ncbi:fasciclin-2-like isoform X2 [Choristoneura fumiferana]|uniref:fasciclin-2-like isoform X2 n=1 Tax=Choristoneura fumiferana TaxID=7141 RepID=UPI003D155BF8
MITKKGFNVFVAVVVIVSTKVCTACFSNSSIETENKKTGESFYKECHCNKPGYTVAHIKWIDPEGRQIQPLRPGTGSKVYTETEEGTVKLYIDSLSTSVAGAYKCETEFEGTKYTMTYNIKVYDGLYFVNTSTSQHLILGEDSPINCEVRGNLNQLNYGWDKEELSIDNDNIKYELTGDGPLIVRNVSNDDAGIYKCSATEIDGIGNIIEQEITVEVLVKPVISEIRASPGNVVLAGSNVTIQCLAEGTPHPEFFWKKVADKRGRTINATQEQNTTWHQEINTILFEEILENDAGVYECTSANRVGSYQDRIKIEVQVAPQIKYFEDVNATEGSMVQVVCKATGNPIPLITVTYNGDEQFQNDSRVQPPQTVNTEYGAELYVTFNNVTQEFGGIYLCQASNGVDNVIKEMNFTVFYPPHFDKPEELIWGWNGKTINMNCEHESNPPAKRTWTFQANDIGPTSTAEHAEMNRFIMGQLNNIQENNMNLTINKKMRYGVYECVVQNELGTAKKIVHLKEAYAPGAIKNVTILNVTASSMTFKIERPDYIEGPPVVGYEAQYDTSDNYNVTNIHVNRTWGLDRKFIVERLKPSTTYTFKFAAKNEAGVGVWTDTMEFETPETSVPEPPTWDESQNGNLRWKSPEANGNPIDHYIIEYCPFYDQVVNFSQCNEQNLTATEFPLDNLDKSRTYRIKLRAHNLHGLSDFVEKVLTIPEKLVAAPVLSAGAIIGLSIVVVFLLLLLFDLLLLCWRRQGVIATCYFKKNKEKNENLQSRDKKGLLVKEGEARPDDSLTRPNNGHREFEYNKTTGVITGKHSTV